jgi:hypothetical protein
MSANARVSTENGSLAGLAQAVDGNAPRHPTVRLNRALAAMMHLGLKCEDAAGSSGSPAFIRVHAKSSPIPTRPNDIGA